MIRLLLFLFLSLPAFSSPLPERMPMNPGDARRLLIDSGSTLRLSQKQVLDVTELGKGEYQLIALRAGVVYVRAVDAKGSVQQSWIVDVASRAEASQADILGQARWKPLLCQETGIRCHAETATISGQSDSLAWLHRAREVCEKHPPCRFQASVSEDARRLTAQRIQDSLNLSRVQIDAEGFVTLESACLTPDPKKDEQWRQWVKERYGAPVQIRCQDSKEGRFRIDVVAFAQKHSDSELGNPIQFGPIQLLPTQTIDVFLKGLSQKSQTKILARPQLAINLGSSLEVSDGMDIATLAPQRDQTLEIWKAVGFLLQIKLLEQRGSDVKIALTLQLSRPREGQRSLDRSGMQTETWLSLDQLQMVGQIQAQTAGFEESRIPWLGSIPLIGALFRWDVESTAESQVYLLLRLQKQADPVISEEDSGT